MIPRILNPSPSGLAIDRAHIVSDHVHKPVLGLPSAESDRHRRDVAQLRELVKAVGTGIEVVVLELIGSRMAARGIAGQGRAARYTVFRIPGHCVRKCTKALKKSTNDVVLVTRGRLFV
jgi:hypothetical protein